MPDKVNTQEADISLVFPFTRLAEQCEYLTNLRDFNNGNATVLHSGSPHNARSILMSRDCMRRQNQPETFSGLMLLDLQSSGPEKAPDRLRTTANGRSGMMYSG